MSFVLVFTVVVSLALALTLIWLRHIVTSSKVEFDGRHAVSVASQPAALWTTYCSRPLLMAVAGNGVADPLWPALNDHERYQLDMLRQLPSLWSAMPAEAKYAILAS